MQLENLSFAQLFAAAEEIGAKYQSPEERAAFKAELGQVAQSIAVQVGGSAKQSASTIWAIVSSDRAQTIYKQVLTVLVLTAVVIGIGLYKAACHYWAAHGQQPTQQAIVYGRRRSRVARWQVSRWIKLAIQKGRDRAVVLWLDFAQG